MTLFLFQETNILNEVCFSRRDAGNKFVLIYIDNTDKFDAN